MDDATLLPRLIAGERAAWDELVEQTVGMLRAVVARVVARGTGPQPDVEDVLQGVFLKLWEDERRRLRTFRGGARLSTWLVAVARREAFEALRGDGRRTHHEAAYRADPAPRPPADEPAQAAARGEERARVVGALAQIPARDRLLVTLVTEEGWSYRSVARVLDLQENSVGPLLQRARARLASALAAETER